MFSRKSEGHQSRIAEAKVLTHLMTTRRPFCFLRMGDNELMYLLMYQAGKISCLDSEKMTQNQVFSGTEMEGNPGLGPEHAERLWRAYENADYVDFHESSWPNEHLINRLQLKKAPGTRRNPSKESSLAYFTWVETEFKNYCYKRKIGFFGAEAAILEALQKTSDFKQASSSLWPIDADIKFLQPFNHGRSISKNMTIIKEQIKYFCKNNEIDTLFLSLGGAAKIIAYELSRELNICCFDFGAMTRALAYAGCDGNRYARSPHYPFFYRLPFDVHMDALEKAMPHLAPEELLSKAHGQVILELVRKEYGWSHAAKEIDVSDENLQYFYRAYQAYKKRYRSLWAKNDKTKKERLKFLHFCGTNKLTYCGIKFIFWFNIKQLTKKFLNNLKKIHLYHFKNS